MPADDLRGSSWKHKEESREGSKRWEGSLAEYKWAVTGALEPAQNMLQGSPPEGKEAGVFIPLTPISG